MKLSTSKNLYKQNLKMKELLSVLYQVAGVHNLPEQYLDTIIHAINDEPFNTEGLLPYSTKESEYVYRLESFILDLYNTSKDVSLRQEIYNKFAEICFIPKDGVPNINNNTNTG